MEHLLHWSKCSIFHNIFKNMIFQRHQKELLWSKGLSQLIEPDMRFGTYPMVLSSNEGSGELAQTRRVARAFLAPIHNVWI